MKGLGWAFWDIVVWGGLEEIMFTRKQKTNKKGLKALFIGAIRPKLVFLYLLLFHPPKTNTFVPNIP